MDNNLLTEGRINPNLGEISELISPAQNYYNSLFVQLQHRMSQRFSLQLSYTIAKSIMLDGMDFNNQFNFSNTHAPLLLDQRHRISVAGVYRPRLEQMTSSETSRAALRLNLEHGYGVLFRSSLRRLVESRMHRSTLSFSNCNGVNDNLNDTAFNQDTANTAGASTALARRRELD